jgi:hypothetical protein
MAPIPPDSEIDGGKIIRDSTGTPTGEQLPQQEYHKIQMLS